MTLKINIKHDIARLRRTLDRQQKKLLPKIVAQALNRTAQQLVTRAGSETAKAMGLPAKVVKGEMRRVRATWRKLFASVVAEGHAFNIARFAARQTKRGISSKAYGKRKVYPRSFLAFQGRTGFIRVGAGRLPIRAVLGPSTPGTLARPLMQARTNQIISERWPINLDQASRRYLKSDRRPRK